MNYRDRVEEDRIEIFHALDKRGGFFTRPDGCSVSLLLPHVCVYDERGGVERSSCGARPGVGESTLGVKGGTRAS